MLGLFASLGAIDISGDLSKVIGRFRKKSNRGGTTRKPRLVALDLAPSSGLLWVFEEKHFDMNRY